MRDVVGWEGRVIVGYAVEVIVTAGEESRAAGGAKGERHEGVSEAHTFGRKTIHIWRLKPRESRFFALLALHDAKGVPALVIGVDEEEIGPISGAQTVETVY